MKSAILNKAIWVEIIKEEGNLCLVRDKDVQNEISNFKQSYLGRDHQRRG